MSEPVKFFIPGICVFFSLTVFQNIVMEILPGVSTALPVLGTSRAKYIPDTQERNSNLWNKLHDQS